MIERPTEDAFGRTYVTAWEMARALDLTSKQFYGLLHAAVLRNDDEVGKWDRQESSRSARRRRRRDDRPLWVVRAEKAP